MRREASIPARPERGRAPDFVRNELPPHGFSGQLRRTTMHSKILLGTVAMTGLMFLAGCNQETASTVPVANAPPTQTAQNESCRVNIMQFSWGR